MADLSGVALQSVYGGRMGPSARRDGGIVRAIGPLLLGLLLLISWGAVPAAGSGLPPQLSEAESEAAARVGAARVLAAFMPPPGALPSAGEPAGDGGLLSQPPRPAREKVVVLTAWWLVQGTPGQMLSYLESHQPAGSSLAESGSSEGLPGNSTEAGFFWPAIPRARGQLSLKAEAVQLAGGITGLRVDAQASWLTPRPGTEVVPSGARLLRISAVASIPQNRPAQGPVTISDRRRIERVVTLLNALPVVQWTGIARPCPADFGVAMRLAFYRQAGGEPIAVARDELGGCGGVQLVIDGRGEPLLEPEGELVAEVSKAIGRKLDFTPGSLQPGGRPG